MTHTQKILLTCILYVISSLPGFSQSEESAMGLYQKGQSLAAKSPEKAYPFFVRAMQLSKKAQDRSTYVNSVNSLASIALNGKGDHDDVFTWAKEAIEVLKDAGKDSALAELHYNVAEFYNLNEEIGPPIVHYKIAIKIWSSPLGEWNKQVAKCYHGLGDVYKYNKFDYLEAERCYERALLIREKIQFRDTAVLYKNYYSLAATNRSQHDFEKAISYGSKAIDMVGRFETFRLEETYGMVANIYRDMEESALAKEYYLKAITLNKKTKDLKKRAWYYMSLGETFKNDSLYDEALLHFSKSYAIYTQFGSEEKLLFVNLLLYMVETYSQKKDDKNFFKKVAEVFRELEQLTAGHNNEAYKVFLLLGDYYKQKRSYDSSLYYYQNALIAAVPSFKSIKPEDNPTEKQIGFVYYIYEGLAKKASVLRSKFLDTKNAMYLKQSMGALILAEKLVSHERNTLDMEDAKWKFLDSNYDLYEDILSNLYEGAEVFPNDTLYNLAFRYFEQSKSRSLADALTQTQQTTQISNQDSLFQLHAELKRELFNTQRELLNNQDQSMTASDQTRKDIAKLREQVVTLDRSIQTCKQAIEEKYPGYFNLKYGYQTPSLQHVQTIIQRREQVMLEYFWGSEWVYALGVSDDTVLFRRIGRPDSIKNIVNRLLVHLSDEHSSMDSKAFQVFTSSAHQLYKMLVEPFSPIIRRNGRIQIIPDGPISQIPFDLLLESNVTSDHVNYRSLKYMIRSHTIGYAYSSSMLVRETRKVVRRPSLLAVGFTGGQRLRAPGPELEDIQGAEQELEALTRRFKTGKFLVGKEATEANFKALSPDFDIIHLAIHGKGDIQKNFSASLYFRSKYDSLDDGELHAYELYGLKLKALMAVLSACESGLGKGYKGEGMISMASAFTYSGCENILMSLWKVNDQASTILMDDFYGELLEGGTIDHSLRLAKLNYLETADEITADPKIWAPLVAYGSLDQVFQKDNSRIYIGVAVAVVLILLLFLKFRNVLKG